MSEGGNSRVRLYGGRFEPEAEVGQGGMGSVYRARDRATGEVVALKVLYQREGSNAARFGQESSLLAELSHPAIVRYIDHGVAPGGEQFLAMEWLEGVALEERLTGGALSIIETAALAARTLDALTVAHRRGIVHRDIKPANIFLPGKRLEHAKLLDFGVARRLFDSRRITRAGSTLGTPMYMSPEQARGEPHIDARADLFSLGCVLFECLTGRPPFTGETPLAVLAKICLDNSLNVAKQCPGLPVAFEQLLTAMLQKDRERRPSDTSTITREFVDLAQRLRKMGHRLPEDESRRVRLRTPTALTIGEERLFSVVMVSLPRQDPRARAASALPAPGATPPPLPPATPRPSPPGRRTPVRMTNPSGIPLPAGARPTPVAGDDPREALVNQAIGAVGNFGVAVDRLYNGSLVVTQTGAGDSVERTINIARCALELSRRLPMAQLALCTAHADAQNELPVSRALERAGWLVMGARRGQIRIDEVSAELLDTRFEVERGELEGRPVNVLGHEKGLREPNPSLLGKRLPCLGRDRELRALEALYDECTAEPAARAALVTAPAGAGKSRVCHEFLERIANRGQPFQLLIARGDPVRAAVPFAVLGAALRTAANIGGDEDAETQRRRLWAQLGRRLASDGEHTRRTLAFMGEIARVPTADENDADVRAAREDARVMAARIREAWRAWLDAETAVGPVVLVMDDLQWGDAASLQLVDEAVRALADRPLLVLGFARPEVEERFPGLWESVEAERMSLRPLTSKACQKLAQQVLPELTSERAAFIVDRADGNPLLLEEMVITLAAGHDVARDAAAVTVPHLLALRLAKLPQTCLRLLGAASVLGPTFARPTLVALFDDVGSIDGALSMLEKQALLVRGAAGTHTFAFRHGLIRDAIYDGMDERTRSWWHQRAAEGLQELSAQEPGVLAEHHERAGLQDRAAVWWRRAAERAFVVGDLAGAVANAERALASAADGDERERALETMAKAMFLLDRRG